MSQTRNSPIYHIGISAIRRWRLIFDTWRSWAQTCGAVQSHAALRQKTSLNDIFFFFFFLTSVSVAAPNCRLLPRRSLITTPSSPRLSVLIPADPSPHWTATHLWRLQRLAQIQSKHTHTHSSYSHNIYLFSLIPGVLFTVRFDFHLVLTCLRCSSLLPAALLLQHRLGLLLRRASPPEDAERCRDATHMK